MKCAYGCDQEANFQLKNGKWCCEIKHHKCPEIRQKNSLCLKKAYLEGRKDRNNLNKYAPEWHGWSKGQTAIQNKSIHSKYDPNKIFCENTIILSGTLKRILLSIGREYRCEKCGQNNIWQNEKITLEMHHKNGIHKDNRLENLQILCPNCHSQTRKFRNRKIPSVAQRRTQQT